MSQQEIDLAREDLQVLHAIRSANRPPTTTTIKEQLHWADDAGQIRYRLDKLEQRGLIDTWQAADRGEPHKMDPRVAELTSAGKEIADDHEDDPETLPLEQRVTKVEKRVDALQDRYVTAKQHIIEIAEEVEQHDDDLEDLAEKIRDVQRFLDFADNGDDA